MLVGADLARRVRKQAWNDAASPHPPALLPTLPRVHCICPCLRLLPSPLQGTRRALLRKASPREFSEGVYNPLAMSSRGRYLLVDNLASTATSGAGCGGDSVAGA